ncbi:MAG: glycosyltransferase family 1 protein [Candidatus Margulisiibacteriota bacterium]|jgi:glycosyltransferase involved in cell wall biosynthesis
MKKIGIIAFENKDSGGIYQYTQSLLDALILDKKNKFVLFLNNANSFFTNYEKNFEIRVITSKKKSSLHNILKFVSLAFNIRSSIFFDEKELNKCKDISFFISPVISLFPHYYLKKPYIITIHDLQEKHFPRFFSLKERITRFIVNRNAAKFARKIICESNYVKNDIIKYLKIPSKKIYLLPAPPPKSFLDYNYSEKNIELLSKKYNLPEKYIFYPANFWLHKNHLRLLEAFKIILEKHPELKLVLTGNNNNYYKNINLTINKLNLKKNVINLGYVDYLDLPIIYLKSKMLVMPSLFESISIPIYEAFALKVPVVASNIVALPEQIGNAGLLFDPYMPNDIADKILQVLDTPKLRDSLSKKGFERIKKFNHNNYLKSIQSLLKSEIII